jgi:hypothetical protein
MGRGPKGNPTLDDIARVLTLTIREMEMRGWLQEWYGYDCVDAGDVKGKAGTDLETHIELVLGYRSSWPLHDGLFADWPDDLELKDTDVQLMEDHVFDLVEFFHDHVSEGTDGQFHSYGSCGWHYGTFDASTAQALLRSRLNPLLARYREGYELNRAGELQRLAPVGLGPLLDAPLLTESADIQQRVDAAVATWRLRTRSVDDMRDAVRNLFDVLELLRPSVRTTMLSKDEQDLFNIANNFSIRHLNELQRGNYDSQLWLSWMFYVNLATVQVITRTLQRASRTAT